MRLKHYQENVIKQLKEYLGCLSEAQTEYRELVSLKPALAKHYNFPKEAWEKFSASPVYHSKTNGLGEPLPDVYLKVPTGGGKTLLACHAIDLVQKGYLKRQTGLVLWIVPSTQIYRQTITALKDRAHPYRQVLDISSGGRTLIKEKTEFFTRLDVTENLVVLMLMLPSANRQNKETLKVFKDAGGFTDFFPAEDNYPEQRELLQLIPNLDCFGEDGEVFNRQIKTSLGNALKVLRPMIVIDEGHRAYGENARNTVRNFNPSFVLELSATPPAGSNELVKITGRQLHEEEMIKLDIHLLNKSSLDWKDTMLASIEKRNELERQASEYEENTGSYIRPICLVQVERTGRDQRDKKTIHAEDAKEYLVKQCNIPESHIAIKSSEKDDIEGIDLYAKDCEIRYIITKQALQEGWDCAFAYILTILTNPSSATAITQLVGRILRQPKAVKTKIIALDECYIYTFRQNAASLVREIKNTLEEEGLGDIAGRIIAEGAEGAAAAVKERDTQYRPGFKKFEGRIYLPKFAVQEQETWRDFMFEADILKTIDWSQVSIKSIADITLAVKQTREQELTLGLSGKTDELLDVKSGPERTGTLEIDEAFLAQQISGVIPNPWICYELGEKAIKILSKKYERDIIAANFIFIIEELKKILEKEKDRLAEMVFKDLIEQKKLCFFLLAGRGGFELPSRIKVKSNRALVRNDNSAIQKSLFDYVPEENMNDLERSVAIYLDEQEKLLWWYRNMSRQDYHIQGWKKHKIYPDFIATTKSKGKDDEYDKVYVLETKGLHLKNEDTAYKKNVFELCNELGTKTSWGELFGEFPQHNFEFQVVFEDEWQNKINRIMQ